MKTKCLFIAFAIKMCYSIIIDVRGGNMSLLREIGVIARALDSIANIEFRDIELARGQYLYLVRIKENPGLFKKLYQIC